jgi:hypothetical protein
MQPGEFDCLIGRRVPFVGTNGAPWTGTLVEIREGVAAVEFVLEDVTRGDASAEDAGEQPAGEAPRDPT